MAQARRCSADSSEMSSFPARTSVWLLALIALAVGCSDPEPAAMSVSSEDVVLAYVDSGMDAAIADCLVGLGSREFELDALLPGAAADADVLLLDEMLRSCTKAVAVLSERDIEERTTFDTGPFNIGDDLYLDELYADCAQGDGAACDRLWEEAPVGSVYESFGVSCGNRPQVLDCTEEMNGLDATPNTAS